MSHNRLLPSGSYFLEITKETRLSRKYVIVIDWSQGIMAVNQPSPRAKPEDKVCLRCHNSLTTSQ